MRSKVIALLLASSACVVAQSAGAADLPAKPIYKAPAAIVAWNWTGVYVGGYVGVGVNKSRSHDPAGSVANGTAGDIEQTGYGISGGGTLGYNQQLDWGIFGQKFVVGVEGDIGYFDTNRKLRDWADVVVYENKTSWLATARARVGLTDGPSLTYLTGGFAAAHVKDELSAVNLPGSGVATSSKNVIGWTVGSGTETMLGGGWSAKTEALYINLESGDLIMAPGLFAQLKTDRREFYTQRFGINYQFGAGKNGPLPQYNWNGFYAGGVFGGGVTSTRGSGIDGVTNPMAGEQGNNGSGWNAGGQVGWNWMVAPKVVVGVEGDVSYLGIRHTDNDFANVTNSTFSSALAIDTSWIATARGRVAYNTGPALLYATGGGAWVNLKDKLFTRTGVSESTKTATGWAVGGGIETVLWGNWTSKTEYLYVDVGNGNTLTDPNPVAGATTITANHKFHMFRGALVYHFNNPEPLRAKF